MIKIKRNAFTLAETLLVIAIIGVVSMLTLPNLSQNTNNREVIAKVKKINANLEDATGRTRAKYGSSCNQWTKNLTEKSAKIEKIAKRILEPMNTSKICGFDSGCFATIDTTSFYSVILSDGTSVAIGTSEASIPELLTIMVDIDGPKKGKGKIGEDIFTFKFNTKTGRIERPVITSGAFDPSKCTNDTAIADCPLTYWIIDYDNIDYKKSNDSGKCKNDDSITLQNDGSVFCK